MFIILDADFEFSDGVSVIVVEVKSIIIHDCIYKIIDENF